MSPARESLRPAAAAVLALVVAAIGVSIAVLVSTPRARAAATPTTTTPTRTTPSRTIASRTRTATTPAAPPAVPQGFVGVDVDGPAFGPGTPINFGNQVSSMVTNGVQSIRVAFSWSLAQPYQDWQAVPPADMANFTNVGGTPFDFQQTDEIVGAAAARGVTVLPTVLYAPSWDALHNPDGVDTPKTNGPYGDFLIALIGRYGPNGSFWRANPRIRKRPVRAWQVWNEENLSYYWRQPFASSYVGLLRVAHAAIKRADPGAKVVLGALTNVAWKSLGQLYHVGGARSLFDVVAVNGFTKLPADVILYMQFMRDAMDRFHDGTKPLLATEVSWPSALGQTKRQFDFDTGEAGQARNIATLLGLIAQSYRRLGLAGFYYYTWMGDEEHNSNAFNFAGLLRFRDGKVTVKPALAAYRTGVLALEHCRRKGSLATSCIK